MHDNTNPAIERALHQITVAELIELVGLDLVVRSLSDLAESVDHIRHNQEIIMTALQNLKDADADLASTVTDLASAVTDLGGVVTDLGSSIDRVDADFAALEQKIQDGADADVQTEVDSIRAQIDSAKALVASARSTAAEAAAAKDRLDATDPAAPAPTPEPPAPEPTPEPTPEPSPGPASLGGF